MANIVELREMSDKRLEEMLENAREELFNLRFQKASARLENYARLKIVRREIGQFETVLSNRQLATEAAAAQPEVARAIAGKNWRANARFVYEESAWRVAFSDEDGKTIATALVNLNHKRARGRRKRVMQGQRPLVTSYEIAG